MHRDYATSNGWLDHHEIARGGRAEELVDARPCQEMLGLELDGESAERNEETEGGTEGDSELCSVALHDLLIAHSCSSPLLAAALLLTCLAASLLLCPLSLLLPCTMAAKSGALVSAGLPNRAPASAGSGCPASAGTSNTASAVPTRGKFPNSSVGCEWLALVPGIPGDLSAFDHSEGIGGFGMPDDLMERYQAFFTADAGVQTAPQAFMSLGVDRYRLAENFSAWRSEAVERAIRKYIGPQAASVVKSPVELFRNGQVMLAMFVVMPNLPLDALRLDKLYAVLVVVWLWDMSLHSWDGNGYNQHQPIIEIVASRPGLNDLHPCIQLFDSCETCFQALAARGHVHRSVGIGTLLHRKVHREVD